MPTEKPHPDQQPDESGNEDTGTSSQGSTPSKAPYKGMPRAYDQVRDPKTGRILGKGSRIAQLATAEGKSPLQYKVDLVVDMMRELTFKRGKTYKVLAKEWGDSEDYVQHITGIASKIVRDEIENPDYVKSLVGTAMEDFILDAIKNPKDQLKRKHAIEAAKVFVSISPGAAAPEVKEMTVRRDPLEGMNRDQLLALAKRLVEKEQGVPLLPAEDHVEVVVSGTVDTGDEQ
jgi:hypothetical protein